MSHVTRAEDTFLCISAWNYNIIVCIIVPGLATLGTSQKVCVGDSFDMNLSLRAVKRGLVASKFLD